MPAHRAERHSKNGVFFRRVLVQYGIARLQDGRIMNQATPEPHPTVQSEPGPKCSGLLPKRLIAAKSFSMQDRWLPGARQEPLWQPESFIMERTSATG
jgi:hypothetical protein